MRPLILIAILLASLFHPVLADDPEAQSLLETAVEHLRAAETFNLEISQTGPAYPLALSFDGINMLPASLREASAQFVNPNELHISAQLQMFIPIGLDIYSRDDRQWLSFPSGAPWFLLPAFEGFDINQLLAEDQGIDGIVDGLQDVEMIETTLDDDEPAWLIRGMSAPDHVASLLFDFIEPQEDVELAIWINADAGHLARIEMTMLETLETEDVPSVWHIEFDAYDAERNFEPPAS